MANIRGSRGSILHLPAFLCCDAHMDHNSQVAFKSTYDYPCWTVQASCPYPTLSHMPPFPLFRAHAAQ